MPAKTAGGQQMSTSVSSAGLSSTLDPAAPDAGVDIDAINPSTSNLLLIGPTLQGRFTLLQSIHYDIGRGQISLVIRVPSGFTTDFASIPWYAQSLFPKFGPHNLAAILHDYLYETKAVGYEIANAIFYEVLRATPGIPKWKAVLMTMAVQLGGKGRYNK